jgi:hypothetical protein
MQAGITPREAFERSLHYWWWLVVFMVVGGIAGWLLSLVMKPIYQAKAEISFNIEYSQTGQLTDVEEDRILGMTGDVLASDEVLQIIVEQSNQNGLSITLDDLEQQLTLERKEYIWQLRVSNTDREIAHRLVSWWAEAGYHGLLDALNHANLALVLQKQFDGFFSCMSETNSIQPDQAICPTSVTETRQTMDRLGSDIQQERASSLGISPALRFTKPRVDILSTSPTRFSTGSLTLGGSVVGFIMGITSLYAGFPVRFRKKE